MCYKTQLQPVARALSPVASGYRPWAEMSDGRILAEASLAAETGKAAGRPQERWAVPGGNVFGGRNRGNHQASARVPTRQAIVPAPPERQFVTHMGVLSARGRRFRVSV